LIFLLLSKIKDVCVIYILKHYQRYKNFIDYSIITSEYLKFKHNSLIDLEVIWLFCLY